ncbi:unnamed protein product [Prorocentrum cordatum]|uniref:DNA2/NAM7 helicase-like C-terminal domain-containing protein n=1 Tax=Prorocentrum cordatum TaxID=2364126 RepID=A0ABN9SBP4_9DINO|nr:unnamed protein product [Polarella glacialis]
MAWAGLAPRLARSLARLPGRPGLAAGRPLPADFPDSPDRQGPGEESGIAMRFCGLEERCLRLFENNLMSIGAVDGCHGDEAALVIACAARADGARCWGFLGDPSRVDVALARAEDGAINGNACNCAASSQRKILAEWGLVSDSGSSAKTPTGQAAASAMGESWIRDNSSAEDEKLIEEERELRAWYKKVGEIREPHGPGVAPTHDAPLPARWGWNRLADDLQTTRAALLLDLAPFPIARHVLAVHPRQCGPGDAPADLFEHALPIASRPRGLRLRS